MRLADLDPRWCSASHPESPDAKQGISFLCPHCRARRLAVFFDRPICSAPPVDIVAFHRERIRADEHPFDDIHVGSVLWHRVDGETFDTLTLTPSIDASAFGCWHGFITAGVMR